MNKKRKHGFRVNRVLLNITLNVVFKGNGKEFVIVHYIPDNSEPKSILSEKPDVIARLKLVSRKRISNNHFHWNPILSRLNSLTDANLRSEEHTSALQS